MRRYLLQPSTLILIAANLVPLVGVIFWDWDAFVLLMLYWLETAVIAFWTIVRIATFPRDALGDIHFEGSDKTASPLGLAAFFMLHAGIFMGVHFLFLWELFSGDWPRKIHGLRDFVDQVIVATGLWVPLIALFIGRGLLMMFESVEPSLRRLLRLAPRPPDQSAAMLSPAETVLFGLYARIFIMQLTIILSAWFALVVGTVGAYVFLIALKTAIDVAFQVGAEALHAAWIKAKAKSAASPPAEAAPPSQINRAVRGNGRPDRSPRRRRQLCGGDDGAVRARRSAMNWSNSALSFAMRRRSRNSRNSRCSSSRRRRVSVRYSSNARLPLDRDGGHQVPASRSAPACQRLMPPPFQQLIRPLPMIKAKVARPTGHQITKPRIINAIQAGFPNSSSFATIGMSASPVNVNNIHIAKAMPPRCQERASPGTSTPAGQRAGVVIIGLFLGSFRQNAGRDYGELPPPGTSTRPKPRR